MDGSQPKSGTTTPVSPHRHPSPPQLPQSPHSVHSLQNSHTTASQRAPSLPQGLANAAGVQALQQLHSQQSRTLQNANGSRNIATATQYNTQIPPLMGSNLVKKLPFDNPADSMSLFSSNGFPVSRNPKPPQPPQVAEDTMAPPPEIPDTIPVSSSTDWQEAFGFPSNAVESHDDDLGE